MKDEIDQLDSESTLPKRNSPKLGDNELFLKHFMGHREQVENDSHDRHLIESDRLLIVTEIYLDVGLCQGTVVVR